MEAEAQVRQACSVTDKFDSFVNTRAFGYTEFLAATVDTCHYLRVLSIKLCLISGSKGVLEQQDPSGHLQLLRPGLRRIDLTALGRYRWRRACE